MKQQVEIALIATYNDKILLEYNGQSKKYNLPLIEMMFKSSPEELINIYFQKKFRFVPDYAEIMDVYDSENEDKFFLLYKVVLDNEKYADIANKSESVIWASSAKVKENLAIDNLTKSIVNKIDKKIFIASVNNDVCRVDEKYILYTDGGSRGNPGHSAIGYAIYNEAGDSLQEGGECIGIAVSGVAEYQAVLRGLESALAIGAKNLEVRVDNLMIAKQMNGLYQVKNRELWPIHEKILELIVKFEKIKFVHIKREFNQIADRLVNKALDDYLTNA